MFREVRSFISYRRSDADGAGRIHERLRREFGSNNVFRDLADIPPASDFPVELERAIRAYLDIHNENPRPFIWTKSADQILANVARFCQRTLDSGH